MTGLDKIIADIREESDAAVRKVQADADARIAALQADADARAQTACSGIAAESGARVQETAQRAASAAQLSRRKKILAAKQELIAGVLDSALAEAKALPAPQYFDAILAMAVRAAHPCAGQICLNAADLARVPADFEQKLNAALAAPARLSLCRTPAELDSGFFLEYEDGVEENGSFRSVFDARRDELQDKVCKILFS